MGILSRGDITFSKTQFKSSWVTLSPTLSKALVLPSLTAFGGGLSLLGLQASGGKLAIPNPAPSLFPEQCFEQTQRCLGQQGAQEGHGAAGSTPRWGGSQPRLHQAGAK